jgi:hypothetical protein
MTYVLRFFPEVEEDAVAGDAWYEEKAQGLGDEFLRMFYACAGEISGNPLISPKVYREFRQRLLRRFPYAIYGWAARGVGGDLHLYCSRCHFNSNSRGR